MAWSRFPEITEALTALPAGVHILDGEATVMRDDRTSDFNLLQARVRKKGATREPHRSPTACSTSLCTTVGS
jgi:ATP-dependent DNA ligase